LEQEGTIGLETEQLRMIISSFNVHYLLMRDETDKLSKYLRSNLHESEDLTHLFEEIRTTLGQRDEPQGDDEAYDALRSRLSTALKEVVSARKFLPRKLYISDLHFYHRNLNDQMDMRGFEDEYKMNAYMIRQWQEHVHAQDEVYLLGDFSVGRGEMTNEILRQLPGKKYLVIGNHDHFLDDKAFDQGLLQWAKPYAKVKDRKRDVILSHYPIFCYDGQYHMNGDGTSKTYMLYGHVHNSADEVLVDSFIKKTRVTLRQSKHVTEPHPIPCNMINCFCMYSDYVPLTLDEWIALDEKRRKEMPDV
jgi:calcineurin-like phosphoesterase family protein